MRAANCGKPVIVTETGIPDGADSRREMWATSYLKAVRVRSCSATAILQGLNAHTRRRAEADVVHHCPLCLPL